MKAKGPQYPSSNSDFAAQPQRAIYRSHEFIYTRQIGCPKSKFRKDNFVEITLIFIFRTFMWIALNYEDTWFKILWIADILTECNLVSLYIYSQKTRRVTIKAINGKPHSNTHTTAWRIPFQKFSSSPLPQNLTSHTILLGFSMVNVS